MNSLAYIVYGFVVPPPNELLWLLAEYLGCYRSAAASLTFFHFTITSETLADDGILDGGGEGDHFLVCVDNVAR